MVYSLININLFDVLNEGRVRSRRHRSRLPHVLTLRDDSQPRFGNVNGLQFATRSSGNKCRAYRLNVDNASFSFIPAMNNLL